jgi:hypothetical protein
MAKVKSTIVSILQKGNIPFGPAAVFFPVGGMPLNQEGSICKNPDGEDAFPNVSSISFCRHSYGQGAAVDRPCYVVSFENSPQVIVIPAEDVGQVSIFKGELNTDNNVPALPED